MKTIKLKIKTNSNNYSILIGTNLLTKIPLIVKRNLIKFDRYIIKAKRDFIEVNRYSIEVNKYLIEINRNFFKGKLNLRN